MRKSIVFLCLDWGLPIRLLGTPIIEEFWKSNVEPLMSPNWDKITVRMPTKVEWVRIEGVGWVLKLKDQYTVQKDELLNNYKLIKKDYI